MSEPAENTPPEVLDLTQKVEESRQAIGSEPPPEKRGRGRPPGSGKKTASAAEPAAETAPAAPPGPSPMVPALAMMVSVPYDIAASKTGCELVKLSRDESLNIAVQVDQVMQLWMPDISRANPKTTALITCALSVGMITFAKFTTYNEWLRQQNASASGEAPGTDARAEPAEPAGDRPTVGFGQVSAGDHFGTNDAPSFFNT